MEEKEFAYGEDFQRTESGFYTKSKETWMRKNTLESFKIR